MSLSPDEICHRLGETRFREMFSCLTAKQMKQMMAKAEIPPVRSSGVLSTKRRNEEWGRRLWLKMPTPYEEIGSTLLYSWLAQQRNAMMGVFLDSLSVPHQNGLTDAEFFPPLSEEQACLAAQALLGDARFDKSEIAAYLLFLDMQHKSNKFASLSLQNYLA